jgi:hypothetical protein
MGWRSLSQAGPRLSKYLFAHTRFDLFCLNYALYLQVIFICERLSIGGLFISQAWSQLVSYTLSVRSDRLLIK